MIRVYVFPGQGSQAVGMGKALADAYPAARAVFQEVDEALGAPLARLMFEGPEETLRLTENAQPALMAVSVAVARVLDDAGLRLAGHAAYVAGHSLGEYSALVAAGSFNLSDAARLLRLRGQAMQRAVPVGEGAMAALLGLDFADASDIARAAAGDTGSVCAPANDNAPGQVVVSGAKAAVDRAIELAKDKGARKSILLPVSAPFHCALMQPAADEMRAALHDAQIRPPVVPLIANVTASPVDDPEAIRRLLVEQVTATVRWRESVQALAARGVTCQVELGAGKVLTGLAKRIDRSLEAFSLGDPAEVDAYISSIQGRS